MIDPSSFIKPLHSQTSAVASEREINEELRRVLSSVSFLHSPRSRLLLQHMVDRYQVGALSDLSECAIGLTVFRRDAATYSTAEDPVVRVQVGRLREKLSQYYATDGQGSGVKISIPLRSYRPLIVRYGLAMFAPHIDFVPIEYLGNEPEVGLFNQGFNEELSYLIYKTHGEKFVSNKKPIAQDQSGAPDVNHRLSGTLRADCRILRVSLRLLSVKRQCDVWRTQVDAPRRLLIAEQARLAGDCSQALENYLKKIGGTSS